MLTPSVLVQVIIAWVYGHLIEYISHRWVLHNNSRLTRTGFRHHFRRHHAASRKNLMSDEDYQNFGVGRKNAFEHKALLFLALLHLPVLFFFPVAYAVLVWSALVYYIVHALAHWFPVWGRRWLPWHYDHHMGKDQHKNWGVRLPFFDYIFGTRVVHIGTDLDARQTIQYIAKKRKEEYEQLLDTRS